MKFPLRLLTPTPNHVCRLKVFVWAQTSFTTVVCQAFWSPLFQGFFNFFKWLSLFIKKIEQSISIVAVYVDDIIIIGNYPSEFEAIKLFLNTEFMIKGLGE